MENPHAVAYFHRARRLVLLCLGRVDTDRTPQPRPPRRTFARLGRYVAGGAWLLALVQPVAFARSTGDVIGRSQGAIHDRFSGVVWSNLNTPAAAARLEALSDYEMEKLAALYINAAEGSPPLQGIIRKYAPEHLPRYERAVAAMLGQHIVTPRSGPRPRDKAPSDFMTLHEIYMEFRTAGSAAATAVYETSRFAGGELSWAFSAGYAAGYLTHEYVCTSGSACDAAVGAATAAVVNYTPPPDVVTGDGVQAGSQNPTGVQASQAGGSGWGPDAYSSEGFGGGAPPPDGGKLF